MGYSRLKLKIVKNRAEFWTFFSPSQILGGLPSQSYTLTPASRRVVWKMFCELTPTSPEVIVANTLNFKAHFKFSWLKVLGDTHPHLGAHYQGLVNL